MVKKTKIKKSNAGAPCMGEDPKILPFRSFTADRIIIDKIKKFKNIKFTPLIRGLILDEWQRLNKSENLKTKKRGGYTRKK